MQEPEVPGKGSLYWRLFPFVLLFIWPWTWNCYFSLGIYDSLFLTLPAILLAFSTGWFVLIIRRRGKPGFNIPGPRSNEKPGLGRTLYYCALYGLVLGALTLLIFDLGALSVVYVTSRTPVRFSSPISLRKNSGGGVRSCRYFLNFYNRPIERDLTVCGEQWNIGGAKSGDTLYFDETVGPLGARLTGIRRTPG